VLPPDPGSVSAILAALVAADRESWSLLTGHHDLGEVAERLRRIRRLPTLPDIRHLTVPADRLPVVIAHGPGFTDATSRIARHRERLWLMAPFRTSVRLIECGVAPDVILWTDRDTWPVAATLEQWRALPDELSRRLRAATLLADAFAPAEVVQQFTRAWTFDSGLGCGTPLPFHGFGVLAGVALALVLGHRHVGVAGVDLGSGSRLATLLDRLGAADLVRLTDLSGGAAAAFEHGPQAGPREPWLPGSPTSPHILCAQRVASGELDALAGLLDRVQCAADSSPDEGGVAGLIDDIRYRWRTNAAVVAAVQRADLRWLSEMWALTAQRLIPVDERRASRMTARLILPELAAALEAHLRDCRSCLDRNLTMPDEAVA